MTRRTQSTAMTQTPVTVRVRCDGELHHVTWWDHRLVLEDHSDEAVKMMDLFDGSSRCMEILRSIRTVECGRPTNVPPQLWKGVKSSLNTLCDRYINPYIVRCVQAEFFNAPTATIHFSTEPPQMAAWFGHAQGLVQRLAIHRAQQWEVDWKAVREYSETPFEHFNARTRHCSLCNYWVIRWVIRAGIHSVKPHYLEHLRSPKHRQRVFTEIARVFEVRLPDEMRVEA